MEGILASLAQGGSPGLQYSTYPYQVPDGHGGTHAYYGGLQQYAPASWFGNVLGQIGQPIGGGFGGQFGNPQLAGLPGGQYGNLNPFAYPMPQQLLGQGWPGTWFGSISQPTGIGLGVGIPQFGSTLGGIGNQLSGSIPFSVPQQAAQQVVQQAANAAQQVGQQVGQLAAQQAAQQAAHQVACQAATAAQQAACQAAQAAQLIGQQGAQRVAVQGAKQLGVQPAQQAALQAAQAVQQVAHQAAHQAALQAAQQVGQQAAQAAQLAGYQVAQQAAAGCTGQQAYNPWNALGAQYIASQQWPSQGVFGNPWAQMLQPFGTIGGGGFGYPQYSGAFGSLGGQPNPLAALAQSGLQGPYGGLAGGYGGFPSAIRGMNSLNPFAEASLGNQTQFAAAPRFSFA